MMRMCRLIAIAALVAACSTGAPPAAVVTQAPLVTPAPVVLPTPDLAGSGRITFGNDYNRNTLKVNPSKTTFKVSARRIAWSAELSEPVGATTVTWIVARKRGSGVENIILSEKVDVSNPTFDLLANRLDLAALVGRKPGTYVMRYLRGSTVLAEGEFTLAR